MVYFSDLVDDVPLSKLKGRTHFHHLMPTPIKATEKTPTIRKKAINYRGTPVTKELFSQNKTKEKCAKSSTKDADTLQIY